jgi:mRNA interferase RelE/StbE
MAIEFRSNASKFLEKASLEDIGRIQEKLNLILIFVEDKGIIPLAELDIKKMKGDWEGFYRLRIGKIRIIFSVNFELSQIRVYTIGTRGDVYK